MTNNFPGLGRGPIDHEASSVINAIANEQLDMGNSVKLVAPASSELLPRVENGDSQGEALYGTIAGGDADGIYGDGSASSDDTTRATLSGAAPAQSAVVVVTQGRTLARVATGVAIGDKLVQSAVAGQLEKAASADEVIATALQATSGDDIIAIDIQREGALA